MYSQDRTYLLKQNEALFQATLNEFSRNPYDIASTNVIIKESSYNKGSFYYRFKAKEDIYYALIDYVYTKNLALFNKDNLNLNDFTEPADLVEVLFKYTKALANEDIKYFELLKRIHHENKSLKQSIENNCLESFQTRVFSRLRDVLVEYEHTELLINNINSILFTYLESFSNLDQELKSIKAFLFKNQRMVVNDVSSETIFLSELPNYLNFLLTDKSSYDLSYFEEYRIKRQLLNESDTLSEIKSLFKIDDVTLEEVVNSGIKRNARDLTSLINLEAINYAKKSYNELSYFQKIVLLTVYNVFLGKEYIIYDYVLDNLAINELKYLFTELFLVASKVVKVVVMEKSAYPALLKDYSVSKIANNSFIEVNLLNSKLNDNSLYIEYLENDIIKNITLDKKSDEFNNFIDENVILTVTSLYKVELKDM